MALIIDELLKNTSGELSVNTDFQEYLKTLSVSAISAFNNKTTFYKEFLEYLYGENSPNRLNHYFIRNPDITFDSIVDYINNNADLHGDFDSIIELMKEDLLNPSFAYNDNLWNSSLVELITYYIEHYLIDEETYAIIHGVTSNYEWGLKNITVEPIDYSWREIDIREADAGASFDFIPEENYDTTGQYGWVVPWYNIDKETFYKIEKGNIYVPILNKKEKLQFTRSAINGKDWIRLLMPQYNRRVEAADLNRNFWVIGQVIAAVSEHLFSDENPIYELLKKIIGELFELWENILYLWSLYAAWLLSKKSGSLIQQAIVMPENNYCNYRTFDIQRISNVAPSLAILKIRYSYLLDMYPNNDLCILPIIRAGNYKKNLYRLEYYPYILYKFAGDSGFSSIKLNNTKGNTLCFAPDNFINQQGMTTFENYFIYEYEDGTYRYCTKGALITTKDTEERLYTGALRVVPQINLVKSTIGGKPFLKGRIVLNIYDAARAVITNQLTRVGRATIDNLTLNKETNGSSINVSVVKLNNTYKSFANTTVTSQSPIYIGECPSTQIYSLI